VRPRTGTVDLGFGVVASDPTATEQILLDAARNLLVTSPITFSLFDFSAGAMVSRAIAEIVNNVSVFGVPVLVADLLGTIGALAAVFSSIKSDGMFDASRPVYLVFDELVLATETKEVIAAIFAHEAWHVNQKFNGIHDDFVNFPRTVDIEYQSFVAGAAVWDTSKGAQTDDNLDAGSACVAQGEARCKEILASDFGYSTGPRRRQG